VPQRNGTSSLVENGELVSIDSMAVRCDNGMADVPFDGDFPGYIREHQGNLLPFLIALPHMLASTDRRMQTCSSSSQYSSEIYSC
jgi:hypothetical protein